MKPLQGLHVVVTRAAHQSESLSHMIRDLGARVEHAPMIRIDFPLEDDVFRSFGQPSDYDYWTATSANAVRGLASLCEHASVAYGSMPMGFVVGSSTARVAREYGFCVQHPSEGKDATALGHFMISLLEAPKRILCLEGDRSFQHLREVLTEHGHRVTPCMVYRTALEWVNPEDVQRWCTGEMAEHTAILLYSPSAAESLLQAGRTWITCRDRKGTVICIGHTTRAWCEGEGIRVDGIAPEPTDRGICSVLETLWTPPRYQGAK